MVAFRMVFRNAYVLVHVERYDVGERNFARFAVFDQLFIGAQRGGTRRKTQYERPFLLFVVFVDAFGNVGGSPGRYLSAVGFDDDSHN